MKYSTILKRSTGALALVLAGALYANAQEPINITTTAVPFLSISPDARAGGMGNLGIATAPDANAVFHNAAKLVFNEDKIGVAASYTPWMRNVTSDIYLATLSGYYKMDEKQAFSASLRYFNIGDIPVYNYSGTRLQNYRPNEFAADLGYMRKLTSKLSVGVSLRYIYSKLADGTVDGVTYSAGNAVAGDVSAYYNGLNEKGEGWTAGLTLSNLGSKISYTNNADQYFLPANLGIGGAYTKAFDDDNHLMIGAEINKLLVPETPNSAQAMKEYYEMGTVKSFGKSFGNDAYQFSAGVEYDYRKMFFVRAGYSFEDKSQGGRQYLTAGAGIRYNAFDVDFAYLYPTGGNLDLNPMSNTLRFGVAFRIGNK